MAVKTIGETRKNLALADSVADSETKRHLIIEPDVAELVEVTEDDESEEYQAESLHHLAE